MTHRVEFAPESIEDLDSIHRSVLDRFGRAAAERAIDRLLDHCEGFSTFPARGRRRDDLRPNLRLVGYRRLATIAFIVEGETVTILRIFAAGREVTLGNPDPSD